MSRQPKQKPRQYMSYRIATMDGDVRWGWYGRVDHQSARDTLRDIAFNLNDGDEIECQIIPAGKLVRVRMVGGEMKTRVRSNPESEDM